MKHRPVLKEQTMKRYNIEPLSETVLEKSGWNKRWSGSRSHDMMTRDITIGKSNRYHIYTTSQLIELFAKRGDVSVRIANREPVAIKAGDQSAVSVLLSTIGRNEVFKILINTMSGPNKSMVGDGFDITMNINVCEFIKLSANSIKSKSNLGPLFEVWNVPLISSQRRSLGLDLK